MSTFNAVKTGPASDGTTFGNAAAATAPTDGDTVDVKGFTVIWDLKLTGAGIIPANTGTGTGYFQFANANSYCNIASMGTQTAKVRFMGSPGRIENVSASSFHAYGTV